MSDTQQQEFAPFPPAEKYAFPWVVSNGTQWRANSGMTLRDYFAGQALAGYLATYEGVEPHEMKDEHVELLAQFTYRVSDAMMRVRAVKP